MISRVIARCKCSYIFFLISLPGLSYSQLSVDVVYPKEGQTVFASDSTFIFGSVNEGVGEVFVNGDPVQVYRNGAFMGYVPVEPGEFVFRCLAVSEFDSALAERTVVIPPQAVASPSDSVVIDTHYLLPQDDLQLIADDVIHVAFKGTPGLFASFSIPGVVENVPMVEAPPEQDVYWGEAVFGDGRQIYPPQVAGIYRGSYRVPPGVAVDSTRVHVRLDGTNGADIEATTPAQLTILAAGPPRIAELSAPMTVARTGPALGYQLFLPQGVKLEITGKRDGHYRARLTASDAVWIPETSLRFLPEGTPVPGSTVSAVRTEDRGRWFRVRVFLQERLPFKIEQSNDPSALQISVYGADSNTDWIRYDFSQKFVKEVSWSQPRNDVYQVQVFFKGGQLWGYDSFYDDRTLVLDIRKPPEEFSLDDKVICIDPGHGPDDGAIGPRRTLEKDANLKLAAILKEKLEDKGATVYLTRKSSHGASLQARTKMAIYLEADLFLSLHYNALPDGVNPWRNRGSSAYYYHPQSLSLAAAIQQRMLKKLELPDYGLYYDNLAVCRITQMPSVLIEPAFIMHPQEETLIKSPKFRKKTAEAIVDGIKDFYKRAREKYEHD